MDAQRNAEPPPREAFQETFRHFFPRLRSYFRAAGFSTADAEDLSQNVLFNVYQNWDQYRGEGTLESWVKASARNAAVDAWRRRGRSGETVELSNLLPDLAPSPDRRAEDQQTHDRVVAALRSLPAGMRTCLLLFAQRELSYKEIAQRLSLSVGTVKVQIWNARRRLRDVLAGEES